MLSGCGYVYKAAIQQGNIITQAMLNELKPGMSETDVIDVLGSPVLIDTFSGGRQDFIYTNQKGHKKMTEQRITCYFENHKLVKVFGNLRPGIEVSA